MEIKTLPLPNEIWKDIPDYKGLYQASNFGRIKSLERTVLKSNGRLQFVPERILKPDRKREGYFKVVLSKNSLLKSFYLHRLVLRTFLGESDLEVNHINGDKNNNSLNNLEYSTHLDNKNHRVKHLEKKNKYGAYKNGGLWSAAIVVNQQRFHLGSFKCKEQAHNAFYEAYTSNHGVTPW